MAFIKKKDPVVMNIKLTSKGRELLAGGNLNFKYFAIGDSEIDYKFNKTIVDNGNTEYTAFNSSILSAADKNPELISFIQKNLSGSSYNELNSVPITKYNVENQVESIGFFTNNNSEYIIDSNHIKQPDCKIHMNTIDGSNVITLLKGDNYGRSGEEPAIGDILFIKWTYHSQHTTDFKVNKNYPTPHLFYKITGVTGTLASGSVDVGVDRNIPDFNATPIHYAGAMILYDTIDYSGNTITNMSSTDYLDESVINFLENSQCPTIVFPYWNLSIIFTEEIAGVQDGNLKYTQFKNKELGGFVSYIQNQAPVLKKLGIVHYTNNSPANVYGEGFLNETPTLDIPTIMWHKSSTQTLGVTLSAYGGQKLLNGLNIYYYDLADETGFIVGKIFPNLKIFVIEDQELLFAMSYKSNRSWTLPNFTITNFTDSNTEKNNSGLYIETEEPTPQITRIIGGGTNIIAPNSLEYVESQSQILRVWDITRYGIQYRVLGDTDWSEASGPGPMYSITTQTELSFSIATDNTLTPDTTYEYRAFISRNDITVFGQIIEVKTLNTN